MALGVLPYEPVRDSYRFQPGYNNIQVKLEGGASRVRRDVLGEVHVVTLQWILIKGQYSKFNDFFGSRIKGGSRPFKMDLLTDAEVVMPHVCRCVGSIPSLIEQKGEAFIMQGTLEVTPNPMVSFNLFLQNVSVAQFVDAGNSEFPTANLGAFAIGRDVLLTGTSDTVNGVSINLDGTYEIDTAPNAFTRTLLNAATINSDWTALNGTAAKSYFPTSGAVVLIPA